MSEKVRGVLLNKAQLAAHYACTVKTIDQQIRHGLPIYKRGKPGNAEGHLFDSVAVANWRENRAAANALKNSKSKASTDGDPTTADYKREAARLDAEKKLMENAKINGEFILVSEILPFLSDRMVEMRKSLLSICDEIRGQYGPECAARVDGLIRDGLENIVAAEEDRLRASEGGQDG